GGSRHDRAEHSGSRDVTEGVTGGLGTETGGSRNYRTGSGASGGDIGKRPEEGIKRARGGAGARGKKKGGSPASGPWGPVLNRSEHAPRIVVRDDRRAADRSLRRGRLCRGEVVSVHRHGESR